ncbi:MAG: phosphatase PAP2 family protein [Clostridiales bacterium]|nr:phosphatase PAP2 family protein [Clostridiales bacterium]
MQKRIARALSFFLLASFSFASLGQPVRCEEPGSAEHKFNKDFLVRFGRDFGSVLTSPREWRDSDLLKLAAISGVSLLVFAGDQKVHDWVVENTSHSAEETANFFSNLGDGGWLLGGIAAIYAAGELGGRDRLRQTALLSLESLTATAFFVWSVKLIVGRSRPSTGESCRSFHPFSFSSSRWSFPSGHAASAFAVATAIADQSEEMAVDALAYSLAALAGVARVYEKKHWAADVFVGSALGYFVAKKICRLNRPHDRPAVSLSFQASPQKRALTLTVAF